MLIKRMRSEDWSRVREIRLRALRDTPDAFGSTAEREEQFTEADWRGRLESGATFLALAGERGLGMAVCSPYHDREGAAGLFGMWVAAETRGQGVGRQLIEAVLQHASAEGFERVLLDVGDANEAAIRLYASCGFEPTGRRGTLPEPRTHIL